MKSSPRRQRKASSPEHEVVETPTPLDIARCPRCEAPMTARNGRNGPYFHCQCKRNRNHAPPQNVNR